MANRALIAKADRARLQAIELGQYEYTKSAYLVRPDKHSDDTIISAYLASMTVKVCKPGVAYGSRRGKGAGVCSRLLWR